jgi:23S rRNA (adenine2503-C2)-methyltransferase
LNFALADDYEVNAKKLRSLFNPEKFMVKITPLHKTISCEENDIKTTGGYTSYVPYQQVEKELKDVGFDVLVFIPSYDEDLGRITCGNAILSGSKPECDYEVI